MGTGRCHVAVVRRSVTGFGAANSAVPRLPSMMHVCDGVNFASGDQPAIDRKCGSAGDGPLGQANHALQVARMPDVPLAATPDFTSCAGMRPG